MKKVLRFINVAITYGILGFLLIGAVAGSLTGKPLLLTAVRSGSMHPTMTRGDLVLLWPTGRNADLHVGDILVFKIEDGALRNAGWVIHRAVDGDSEAGFVTQGDNNETSDQHNGANRAITKADIAARAVTIGSTPLHLPLVGFLPLLAEQAMDKPAILAGAALFVLALAFFPQSARRKEKKRRMVGGRHEYVIYMIGGASVFTFVMAAGLMLSQHFEHSYAVSVDDRAALMGSSIGQLRVGDEVQRSLTTVENKGGQLPLVFAVSVNDRQVNVEPKHGLVKPGETLDVKMTIHAKDPGNYTARIHVGLFYPILPAALIQSLAGKSYWLALAAMSFVLALPIFCIPLFESSLRDQLFGAVKRSLQRFPLKLG